jgi:hypothetical protein
MISKIKFNIFTLGMQDKGERNIEIRKNHS